MGNSQKSHLCVRINDLHLTRAVEQTAIMTSWSMGRGMQFKKRGEVLPDDDPDAHWIMKKTPETFALASMLGYLHEACCRGRVVFKDQHKELHNTAKMGVNNKKLWDRLGEPFGHLKDWENPSFDVDLEFVFSAADGVDGLVDGGGEVVSVLAGGPKDSFNKPDAARYFVLCVNSSIAGSIRDDRIHRKFGATNIDDDVVGLIREIQTVCGKRNHEFVISSMSIGDKHPFKKIRSRISRLSRMRSYQGSPVAAAMAACLPHLGVDAFAAVVNSLQATLIAIACLGTGGQLFAFPVCQGESLTTKSERFLGFDSLLNFDNEEEPDVFLSCTGVTETLPLRGVRYRKDGLVATNTCCIRTHTRSSRYVRHLHDMEHKQFRVMHWKDGLQVVGYDEAVTRFTRLVRKR